MHFHAEHPLFFERRQPLWRAVATLTLTSAVLLVNAGASSTTVSMISAGVGVFALLLARARGHGRLAPALTWVVVLIALAVLGGVSLSGSKATIVTTGARVLCGVIWVLFLGTQVDWASLRVMLLRLRVPQRVVADLDHALMHGVFTQREWARRRDAARLCLGTSRLPVASWGPLLGEGAWGAFHRLERAQEHALLRSTPYQDENVTEALHVRSVDIERGGRVVLEQLDMRLDAGEWLLLCGPSGAGKSSVLRLLAGLDGPARGEVSRFGAITSPNTTLRARLDGRVALLSQNPEHHFIASTVAENIAWGMHHRGADASETHRRCVQMAEALRIDHLLERPCHELSFGEQRRVALAGILVLEPALLLIDEPTAGLDPVAAHELRTLIEQCTEQTGAACVWATHDLHTLPSKAERIVLLRDRRVLFDGPATKGLSQPWLVRAGLALPQDEP